jgi:hypothetical protein
MMTYVGLCLRNGCRSRWTRSVSMAAAAWLVVSLGTLSFGTSFCFADEPDEGDDTKDANKAKLQALIAAFDDVEITVGEDRAPLKFHKTPVLNWPNITRGTIVGGTFIWTKDERPEVIGCLYDWEGRGIWFGIQAVSSPNLVARKGGGIFWRSKKPDVEFIKLDGAPVPADSPVKRLSQMKDSANRFRARVHVHTGGTEELRLLTTPIYRYKSGETIDGALFALVQGTDPEVILHLEANRRKTDQGEETEWQYAISRRSGRPLDSMLDDKAIWSVELSQGAPNQPFYEAPLGQ